MPVIEKLHLSNFRNFDIIGLEFRPGISLILGANGIGKTNLLEAISQLTPGRGIRGAAPELMCRNGALHWAIEASLETKLSSAKISLSYDVKLRKKSFEFNGAKITQSELANFTSSIWLTPQMDGIFNGPPSDRRRFLDRLTLSMVSSHASLVNKAEKLQRERIYVLENNFSDNKWLDVVENELASLYLAISQNRKKSIDSLNGNINAVDSKFPKVLLEQTSQVAERDASTVAAKLRDHRSMDRDSGRTNFGSNKDDFLSYYMPEKIPSNLCSTGQQKSLLISILMAHHLSLRERDIAAPLLLLDEVFVHLDDAKREALSEFLQGSGAQCFITSTESQLETLLKSPAIIYL